MVPLRYGHHKWLNASASLSLRLFRLRSTRAFTTASKTANTLYASFFLSRSYYLVFLTLRQFCDQTYRLLVSFSSIHCCTYTHDLSTSSSLRSLMGISYLEVGFTLRCFQRLSSPHFATRPCNWRYNRFTIGAFILVLSY